MTAWSMRAHVLVTVHIDGVAQVAVELGDAVTVALVLRDPVQATDTPHHSAPFDSHALSRAQLRHVHSSSRNTAPLAMMPLPYIHCVQGRHPPSSPAVRNVGLGSQVGLHAVVGEFCRQVEPAVRVGQLGQGHKLHEVLRAPIHLLRLCDCVTAPACERPQHLGSTTACSGALLTVWRMPG